MTLNGQNAYTVTSNQKVIRWGRNVRLMLILVIHLYLMLLDSHAGVRHIF